MSLEYPPTTIGAYTSWIKDVNDRWPTHSEYTTYATSTTYKTTVTSGDYGIGEYVAFTNNPYGYDDSANFGSNEWPPLGPFNKVEGDSSSKESWHTSVAVPTSSDDPEPVYLGIQMPERIKLNYLTMKTRPGFQVRSPKKFRVMGSNGAGPDGTWTEIQTFSSSSWSSGETKTFNVTSPSLYFSDYRFDILQGYNSSIQIYTIKLFGEPFRNDQSGNTAMSLVNKDSNINSFGGTIRRKNSTSELKMSDLRRIYGQSPDGSFSLGQITKNAMVQMGKRNFGAGETKTFYFNTPFLINPGVFIGAASSSTPITATTLDPPNVTAVTTTSFTVYNAATIPVEVHWVALRQGAGHIMGKEYYCEVRSTGTNWSPDAQSFNYSSMSFGNVPYVQGEVQTNNNSQRYQRSVNSGATNSSCTVRLRGSNTGNINNAETIALLAVQRTSINEQVHFNLGTQVIDEDSTISKNFNDFIADPIILHTSEVHSHTDNCTTWVTQYDLKGFTAVLKEYDTDGNHGSSDVLKSVAFSNLLSWRAKPIIHLDANACNEIQGYTAGTLVERWLNIGRQTSVKYFVGYNNPYLRSDSNGYYVEFGGSADRFQSAQSIAWKFDNPTQTSSRGMTCICVIRWNNTSQNWSRIFDFGNGSNSNNILFAKPSNRANFGIDIRESGATYAYRVFSRKLLTIGEFIIMGFRFRNNNGTGERSHNWIMHSAICPGDSDGQDGETEYNAATVPNRTMTNCYIGRSNWGSDAYLNGDIRELLMWERCLPYKQIHGICRNLANKWGLNDWVLVFRQKSDYLWTGTDFTNLNEDEPWNDNYSIMLNLEDYRNTDGKFRFRYTCETTDGVVVPYTSNNVYTDWRQTSNPNDFTNSVTGLETIYTISTTNWGGLSKTSRSEAIMDGQPTHNNWWWALGMTTNRGTIPGPEALNVEYVELWVYKEN